MPVAWRVHMDRLLCAGRGLLCATPTSHHHLSAWHTMHCNRKRQLDPASRGCRVSCSNTCSTWAAGSCHLFGHPNHQLRPPSIDCPSSHKHSAIKPGHQAAGHRPLAALDTNCSTAGHATKAGCPMVWQDVGLHLQHAGGERLPHAQSPCSGHHTQPCSSEPCPALEGSANVSCHIRQLGRSWYILCSSQILTFWLHSNP